MLARQVEKIDKDGNVLKTYNSVREAAKDNFMCIESVRYRCSGKMKKPFKIDNFTFRYKGKRVWQPNEQLK